MESRVTIRLWKKIIMVIIIAIIICLTGFCSIQNEKNQKQITQILEKEKWVLYSIKQELG